jgi:thiosulfate reductase cytochrome b subunit
VRPRKICSAYERTWHWIQALSVLTLIWTGAKIHFSALRLGIEFPEAVRLHVAAGVVLAINAFLGFFYYASTGEFRQLLPDSRNFLRRTLAQARFYLLGAFRGEPFPFERGPDARLNPLQRVTYLMLLNLLLPLQVVTGAMLVGVLGLMGTHTTWGQLGVWAIIHTAGAWLFCMFLCGHIYLITTGATPGSHLKSMLTGFDQEGEPQGEGEARVAPRGRQDARTDSRVEPSHPSHGTTSGTTRGP